jgi:hypothetical protein
LRVGAGEVRDLLLVGGALRRRDILVREQRGAQSGFGLEQVDRGVRHAERVLLVEGERQLLQRLLELIGLELELDVALRGDLIERRGGLLSLHLKLIGEVDAHPLNLLGVGLALQLRLERRLEVREVDGVALLDRRHVLFELLLILRLLRLIGVALRVEGGGVRIVLAARLALETGLRPHPRHLVREVVALAVRLRRLGGFLTGNRERGLVSLRLPKHRQQSSC